MPTLLEDVDRVPAVEILLANPTTKKLIAEGREADLPNLIRSAKREGMQDLTDNLCSMILEGIIDPKEGFKFAPNEEELKMALKGIRTTSEGIL